MSQFALSTGNLLYMCDYFCGDLALCVWYILEKGAKIVNFVER